MRKALVLTIVGLVVTCGAAGALVLPALAKRAQPKEPVQEMTVGRDELLVSVVESGAVEAVRAVEVKSRVTGRLAQLFVDEGGLRTRRGQDRRDRPQGDHTAP